MYIVIIFIGVVINFILSYLQLTKRKVSKKDILIIVGLQTIGLFLGSKLLDILVNFDIYINHDLNYNIHTGSMFYGGFILTTIIVFIYNRIRKIENIDEVLVNNIIVLYAIWKLGCYFNGCCNGINNFPLQIFESVTCIILYLILNKIKKTEYLLIFFSIERFFSIILRNEIDEKNMFVNIFISSVIFMIALVNKIYLKRENKKHS